VGGLDGGDAAVHAVGPTGAVRRLIGGEEQHQRRDLVGRARATERDRTQQSVALLRVGHDGAYQWSVGEAGDDGVDSNSVSGVVIGHIINALAREGRVVLFASSELSELANLCDLLVLYQGRIRGELYGPALTEHRLLEAINTGEV